MNSEDFSHFLLVSLLTKYLVKFARLIAFANHELSVVWVLSKDLDDETSELLLPALILLFKCLGQIPGDDSFSDAGVGDLNIVDIVALSFTSNIEAETSNSD